VLVGFCLSLKLVGFVRRGAHFSLYWILLGRKIKDDRMIMSFKGTLFILKKLLIYLTNVPYYSVQRESPEFGNPESFNHESK
jgi:hypothetical protein